MRRIIYLAVFTLIYCYNLFGQVQTDIPWPTLLKSDWPMIKHDPQFTGRSPYRGPQTATVVWTRDMKDGIFSGPVIGEKGNLYFGSYFQDPLHQGISNHFYCYSSDGDSIWTFTTDTPYPPQSGIVIDSSNTIYFGTLDGYLYALNPNGTLKWNYNAGWPIVEEAIPNIDLKGDIYVTNSNGELFSIKPNGTLNWKVKYGNDGFFYKSPAFSPDGNTIYIFGADSNLFALNLDGSIKWEFSCGETQKAPLVDNQGNLYFEPKEVPQFFYALTEEGNVKWKFRIQNVGPIDMYSMPTMDYEGNLYTIAVDSTFPYYKILISLNNAGKFRWEYVFNDEEIDDFWQPLICDSEGTIYIGSTRGYYYYAISSQGELKWKLPLNDFQVDNTGAISKYGTLYLGVHKTSLGTNYKKTLIAIRDTGIVSVNGNNNSLKGYSLFQNYPNPFNPSTKIKYSIPISGVVKLIVYNILGQEIKTLVNEYKRLGTYEIQFNGSNLPSGVYIYSLKVNGYAQSKKMILLR